MTTSIQIRDVPEGILRTLKARAAASGISLSGYLLAEVTRIAERPTVEEVLARATRYPKVSTQAIVDAVRSGRDRE